MFCEKKIYLYERLSFRKMKEQMTYKEVEPMTAASFNYIL